MRRLLVPLAVALVACHALPPPARPVASVASSPSPSPPPPLPPPRTHRLALRVLGSQAVRRAGAAGAPRRRLRPRRSQRRRRRSCVLVEPVEEQTPARLHALLDELRAWSIPGVALRRVNLLDAAAWAELASLPSLVRLDLSGSPISTTRNAAHARLPDHADRALPCRYPARRRRRGGDRAGCTGWWRWTSPAPPSPTSPPGRFASA